jgi:ribosome-binding protein aMBF1 (putative translation factor)
MATNLRRRMDQLKIWKSIRDARETAKMSQADLARKIGVEQQVLIKYESGELEPTTLIIMAIADALKIAPKDLLNQR